jgi:hypothetical protein
MENHPNSHIVYIRRRSLFDTANRPELEEYFADSSIGVGSYFTKGTAREASGLSIPEENILLPFVLGIPADDRDFRLKVNEYYSNINSKIPADSNPKKPTDGLALEIGLHRDNSAPVSAKDENLPINIEQFLRYRQISGHPWVGISGEDDGNQLKRFLIVDPKKQRQATKAVNEEADIALTRYIQIKQDRAKVRMYLRLTGHDLTKILPGEEVAALRTKAQSDPVNFNKAWNDPYKEHKYLIEEMVAFGLLKQVGTRILYGQTEIGRNLEESVLWLKDPHHSDSFRALRALLDDAWTKNSVSFDTIEDATQSAHMDDSQIEEHLKRQGKLTNQAIDLAKDKAAKGGKAKSTEPKADMVEQEPQRGLDIKSDPEVDVIPEEGTLGDLDNELEGDDVAPQELDTAIPDDGRAQEPTPDTIR